MTKPGKEKIYMYGVERRSHFVSMCKDKENIAITEDYRGEYICKKLTGKSY